MINKAAKYIAHGLAHLDAISSDDIELYRYAAFRIIFAIIPILILGLIGLLCNSLLTCALFMLTYAVLRKYSGGFHFKSSYLCLIFSTLLLIGTFQLTSYIIVEKLYNFTSTMVLSAACICFFLSPINTKRRKLSEVEIYSFKRTARRIILILLILYTSLCSLSLWQISIPIGMGVVLTAVLQIPYIVIQCIQKKNPVR